MQSAIGGMQVSETVEGRERYPINLRYPQSERQDVQSLNTLSIVTPTGAHVTLGDVAKVFVTQGPPVIKTENAQLTGWVLVDIVGRDIGSYITAAQKIVKEKLKMPAGYRLVWAGQYEQMQRAKNRLLFLVPLTLALIFFLLYLNSRSIIEVLIIMGTLPLSLIGGVWLLYWLNYNMSVAVYVGFIALTGVAVETGMVLLNYLNNALSARQALAKKEKRQLSHADIITVIKQGALYRVRPIMMAVAATFAGILPIMFIQGTGSEMMRRIAAPMVGGLITATILTLVVIPAIYYLWKKNLVKSE